MWRSRCAGRHEGIPHFRWYIFTLVFLAAVLNYLDRQTRSTLAPFIQRDPGMSDRD